MPCVNGGMAVGIGLDYLFARWQHVLHPGDMVYLPMEPERSISHARGNRGSVPTLPSCSAMTGETLAVLPPTRWLAALFSFDLRSALMAPIETARAHRATFMTRVCQVTGTINAWGDHIGHTADLGRDQPIRVGRPHRHTALSPRTRKSASGYGTALIGGFIPMGRHALACASSAACRPSSPTHRSRTRRLPRSASVYLRRMETTSWHLPNSSDYPRGPRSSILPEHLNETWQIIHSTAVAEVWQDCCGPK